MVLVIDDKLERRDNYLENSISPFFKLLERKEIKNFQKYCNINGKFQESIIEGRTFICVHATSLFDNIGNNYSVDQFIKQCSIPVVLFSGGYIDVSTIITGKLYTANVKVFYEKVNMLETLSPNPSSFLFGDEYILSRLFGIKELARIYQEGEGIDVLLDEQASYEEPELQTLFKEIEKLDSDNNLTIEAVNNIIDREIKGKI